ncbi:MAG: M14 family metallocarboxypeptidase [Clostridia bacterium]|nr:M14 family metallocarboxypeptidase [Clostridia bacterium]
MKLTNPFDHAALLRFLDAAQERFPFCERLYLGNSILERPIPMLRIGTGARQVLYVGAHHGMEWITSALLCRFLWELCEAIEAQRRLCALYPAELCQSYTLYILPMLNPDGVEYQIHGLHAENPLYERVLEMNGGSTDFSHWQANARGVDLNHNYDAGFAEYKRLEAAAGILQGAPTRYSGECPESEIEVSLLCNFIRFQEHLCGVMTLHTQGEEIFYRSGGVTLPKSTVTARRLSALTGYRESHAEGLASYGGLTDWCVQKLSIPAFTLECGKGCNPLPFDDLPSIYLRLRNALVAFPTIL